MQTSINKAGQPVAVAGQQSDTMEGVDKVSRYSDEATATIGFGLGVKRSTNFRGVKLLTTVNDVIEGVVKWGFNHVPGVTGDVDQTATPPGLKPKAGFELIRRGRLWVVVDSFLTTITPGDRGYCRALTHTGVGTVVGAFTNAADSTYTIDCTTQVQFVSGIQLAADGTKIAELEVAFVNK